LVGAVDDRAVLLAGEGRGWTGRDARRLQTVEAAAHGEGVPESTRSSVVGDLVRGDQGIGVGVEDGRVLDAQLVQGLGVHAFLVVPLLAGNLTGPAPDAVVDVDQRGPDRLVGSGRCHHVLPCVSSARTMLTRQALVSCVPAPGSPASM